MLDYDEEGFCAGIKLGLYGPVCREFPRANLHLIYMSVLNLRSSVRNQFAFTLPLSLEACFSPPCVSQPSALWCFVLH